MKRVWILNEGSQGHVVQSRGLARELAKFVPIEVTEVEIISALPRKLSRSLVKRLLRAHRKMWLFRWLHPQTQLPSGDPDLIISSGPHSLAALEFLSKHHGCPSVFVQGTLAIPPGIVTCIMRPTAETRDDIIPIPLLFNEITPERLEEGKRKYLAATGREKTAPLKALFIGESSAKIRFEPADWDHLIGLVNRSWADDGIQWLISTSYRTRVELEDRLRQGIDPSAIADAVWYSKNPRKITAEFLGMADRVFVTMDSLTMMTEAVASGRPVEIICPENQVFNPDDSHHRYIGQLEKSGLVHLLKPHQGRAPVPASAPHAVVDYSGAVRRMIEKIAWNP